MKENLVNYIKILGRSLAETSIFITWIYLPIFLLENSDINLSFQTILLKVLVCVIITNFASSANYCINEYLTLSMINIIHLKKIGHQ